MDNFSKLAKLLNKEVTICAQKNRSDFLPLVTGILRFRFGEYSVRAGMGKFCITFGLEEVESIEKAEPMEIILK